MSRARSIEENDLCTQRGSTCYFSWFSPVRPAACDAFTPKRVMQMPADPRHPRLPVDLLVLSRYGSLGASSRVRSYQYLDSLRDAGLTVDVQPMFDDAYVAARNRSEAAPRIASVARAYWTRLRSLRAISRARAIWVEYELLPWLPFVAERWLYASGRPVIVDYDDAIFHRYDRHPFAPVRRMLGGKIGRIMASATALIVGNEYLAERARESGASRIHVLPSVVDLARYRQRTSFSVDEFVVGWVGSRSTTPFLKSIGCILGHIAGPLRLRLVNVGGAHCTIPGVRVDNYAWSEDSEIERMLEFDVGVMPLTDEPWTRGKCGYKLIQYMGCGLPTIASPVGVNAQIVDHGTTGFLASSAHEWEHAFRALAHSPRLRAEMGQQGYERVARRYSLAVTAPKLVEIVQSVVRRGGR
jgi:glycosyltransferase involved in cell wall biosynthesis